MTPERYVRIVELFEAVAVKSSEERAAFLAQACAGDNDLRQEVETMVAADKQTNEFLENAPDDLAAEVLSTHHAESLIGQRLGDYQILSRLGSGGMGEVYLARDTRLGRKAALKLLPEEFATDPEWLRRFEQEALAVSALNHPNILTIYGGGQVGSIYFMAMELVEGQTLREEIALGAMDWQVAIEIGAQIASALSAAHETGIVHRDIKPENIILRADGLVKVLDFGLAKRAGKLGSSSGSTQSLNVMTLPGVVMGTVRYMSPEQVRGYCVDSRTDLFSLGVVLYEMVAGQPPFGGQTISDVIATVLKTEPPAIGKYAPDAPAELERILRKALRKDLEERYQSAGELALDLKNLKQRLDFELKCKPSYLRESGSSAVPVQAIPPRRLGARWTLVLTLLSGIAALFWLGSNPPVLSFAARDWVLITDFDNQTSDPLFNGALATAFTVGLEESAYANVVPRARADAALSRMGKGLDEKISERLGREICIRENIRALVSCSLGKVGGHYLLSARIIDPLTGDTVRSVKEQARSQDKLLDALGSLARRIRSGLGESLPSIGRNERPLAMVTTPSLQALRLFSDGTRLWNKGEHDAAVGLYKEAIQQDPAFAMAHAALGKAFCSHIYSEPVRGKQHFDQALQRSDRITERERLLIRAEASSCSSNFAEALAHWKIYFDAYPDDASKRYSFGTTLMQFQLFQEAIEQYREVIRATPNYANAYINLATCYTQLGKYSEAISHYVKAFELEPTWIIRANLNHEYGFTLVLAGDAGKAGEVFQLAIDKPESRSAGLRSVALLNMYEGKFRDAQTRLRESILENQARKAYLSEARDHLFLSIVLEGQGDRAGCLRELGLAEKALARRPPLTWLSTRIGVAYARAGATEKAKRILQQFSPRADVKAQIDDSDFHRLEGEIALASGHRAQATEKLLLADREAPGVLTVESLAHAWRRLGNTEQAIAWGEKLAGLRQLCTGWEPQQAWIAVHYDLATSYAARGEKAKAARLLAIIADLWKGCDADLPLARKVARLQAELRPH